MPENNERSLILVLLAILLPPLAVFLKAGIGLQFLLSILLTLGTSRG